ncbi:hypothetical protein K461DRAFT_297978 [Myriangium duriaei CBS 260.36]|uniref:Rhodopsin domain-containing protein n=1 Tax=Myriangium duriaei CBS 260.36 TaxID=1168546 RepID=A0A9P4MG44_9PEZI|nr:hypothetical protein K461DRAFT_297978 [Myriangium duriaei CBS 260.36]
MALATRNHHLHLAPRAVTVSAINWTECGIALILIALRIYGGSIRVLRWQWDFFFVVLAAIFGLVTMAISVPAFQSGLGWHIADLTYPEVFEGLKFLWIGLPIGVLATCIAKLAIVALLLQVTTIAQPGRRWFLLAIGVINTAAGVAQVAISLTQCEPYAYLWYRYLPGSCPRAQFAAQFSYFQGGVTGITDLILALYPITIAWTLNVSLRTKIGFCGLMAGGLICMIGPIERSLNVKALVNPPDPTYTVPLLIVWAMSEMWLITIIACIPPLRPLFIKWFRSGRRSSTNRSVTGRNTPFNVSQFNKGSMIMRGQPFDNRAKASEEELEKELERSSSTVVLTL